MFPGIKEVHGDIERPSDIFPSDRPLKFKDVVLLRHSNHSIDIFNVDLSVVSCVEEKLLDLVVDLSDGSSHVGLDHLRCICRDVLPSLFYAVNDPARNLALIEL